MQLFSLLLVPFAFTMGGFAFSGLLDPMARDLGVSVAQVGTLQSAFALTCAVSGPLLARITARLPRKRLLLATLVVLTALNLASAFAPGFGELMVLRVMLGLFGALALPLAIAIATILALPEKRAKAIATVYSGVAIAMMLGVPMGSLAGATFGWEYSFALTAAVCALTLLLVWQNVPAVEHDASGPQGGRLPASSFAHLGVTFLAFGSMFALVGYLGPVITALTGFNGQGIAAYQMLSGVGCLAGLVVGARLASAKGMSVLALLFAGIFASLIVVGLPLVFEISGPWGMLFMFLSVAIGPVALFATAPVVQTRLAEAAGPSATFAFALNGSMVYLGQGTGIAIGAAAIGVSGLAGAPMAGAALGIVGMVMVLVAGQRMRRAAAASFDADSTEAPTQP